MGGVSAEHPVSLRSAAAVAAALREAGHHVTTVAIDPQGTWRFGDHRSILERAATELLEVGPDDGCPVVLASAEGKALLLPAPGSPSIEAGSCDVVFPVLHGPGGEDGSIQGLLETLGVPFVGAGCAASAMAMDKLVMKTLCLGAGIAQVEFLAAGDASADQLAPRIEETFGFPCFVKPARLGSSVGISRVSDRRDLSRALESARRWDRRVLVERAVRGREIEIAMLGSDEPELSPPGEIVTREGFYDFDSKYVADSAELRAPTEVDQAQLDVIRELATAVWKLIGCRGLARADFFIEDGRVLFNELNTIPGFTAISMFPRLWACAGLDMASLVDRLVRQATGAETRTH
ncbi:MAG: D-alanine--D-alanine ligase [Deltaproteobacteria bacterium]|nr:MAG: D-alanine--D-alanine ligase [Deltaproteobacteria bacterium]